jgi:prolyl 4-hydroxylase
MPVDVNIPASLLENHPDRFALSRLGAKVRARLASNPAVYKFPVEKAEIWAVGDFLSARDCARMVELVDDVAQPSKTFEMDDGKVYGPRFRTSYSGDVDPWDPFIQRIQRRIDDLLGIDPSFGETVQGQRYEVGQEFRSHFDWFPPDAPYWPREMTRGGQRSFTTMAFLNDVEAGGTTDFTAIGLSIEPKPGVLLIWNNATPEGVPNKWTMHAGMPVLAGTKYIITKWYRTRKWGER